MVERHWKKANMKVFHFISKWIMLLNVFQAPDHIEILVILACFENMQQSRQCIENSLGFENDRNVVVVYLMVYSHLWFTIEVSLK